MLVETIPVTTAKVPTDSANELGICGYGPTGKLLWRRSGFDIQLASKKAPAALLSVATTLTTADGTASCRLFSVDSLGRAKSLGRFPRSFLQPLSAEPGLLSYAWGRAGSLCYCALSAGERHTLTLPRAANFAVWSTSADGRRVAGIQPARKGYVLSWIVTGARGEPVFLASSVTAHAYVALSPDGREAVLGGDRPQLVSFGRAVGRPLPLNYVSFACFSGNCILLQQTSQNTAASAGGTARVELVNVFVVVSGKKSTATRVIEGATMVHQDPSLQFLAWVSDADREAHVMRLSDGARASLPGRFDDITFTSDERLVAVNVAGALTSPENPLTAP